jgi:Zn-finger nucleic acid-binding protein
MALRCPQCATQMKEVTAPASLGYSILLDQCPQCGGVWCDRWEIYPVTVAAADRIDGVDQDALRQPTPVENPQLDCPRCRARLRKFHDPSLPPEACIERCPNCDGMWLNRGELRRFKHRKGSGPLPAAAPDNSITDAQLDRLAQQTSPVSAAAPVRDIANAFDAAEPAPDRGEVGQEIAASAAWLIARTALRLLLHV